MLFRSVLAVSLRTTSTLAKTALPAASRDLSSRTVEKGRALAMGAETSELFTADYTDYSDKKKSFGLREPHSSAMSPANSATRVTHIFLRVG